MQGAVGHQGPAGIAVQGGSAVTLSGSYVVGSTGGVTAHLVVSNGTTLDDAGAISTTKDLVVLKPATNDNVISILVKHTLGNFSDADLAGVWDFNDESAHGTLDLDGKGNITGGTYLSYDNENNFKPETLVIDGPGTYSVTPDGTVSVMPNFSSSSDFDAGSPTGTVGTINDSKDVIAFENLGSDFVFVKRTTVYSNADAVGTWTLEHTVSGIASGTITFDGKGGLSGNGTNSAGASVTLTGTYAIAANPNGTFTAHIVASDNTTADVTGTMNGSKNFIAFSATAPTYDNLGNPNNDGLGTLVKNSTPSNTCSRG